MERNLYVSSRVNTDSSNRINKLMEKKTYGSNEKNTSKNRWVYRITAAVTVMMLSASAVLSAGLSTAEPVQAALTGHEIVEAVPKETQDLSDKSALRGTLSHEGYKLEKAVVLSRHNIRSPLSGKDSYLSRMTPHEWFSWTSAPSELSLRGGVLETEMGQYFRLWLETEGLFPENYHPVQEQVRIYANSRQRTIASANYFSAGLFPSADVNVETQAEFNKVDPVFGSRLLFADDTYIQDVRRQADKMFRHTIDDLSDNYELIEDVLDFEDSEGFRNGETAHLRTDDLELVLKAGQEPTLRGSLKNGGSASDALVLQYYEEPDSRKAAFNKDLTREQWKMIAEVKDTFTRVLFSNPLVYPQTAHPLLQEIQTELAEEQRRFTFLCGHDNNLCSVLASLGTEAYRLEHSIEDAHPIGSKLVFGVWRDENGSSWISLDLVYQTDSQLRNLSILSPENPPAIFPIVLKDLERNMEGLYDAAAFNEHLEEAIHEYDRLLEKYGHST